MSNPDIYKYGFGSRPREVDDALRAKSHEAPRRKWTKEKCVQELEDSLDILKKLLKDEEKIDKDDKRKSKNETIRDITILMNKILDYMKYLYPPVQENVNLNIDITTDAVIERLKRWKKEQIVMVEENGK